MGVGGSVFAALKAPSKQPPPGLKIAPNTASAQNPRVLKKDEKSGLVVAMTTFGAVYAGIHGAQITGSFLGVGGLGTIVATFISGRKLPAKTQAGGD
jgi:hypothetical protein